MIATGREVKGAARIVAGADPHGVARGIAHVVVTNELRQPVDAGRGDGQANHRLTGKERVRRRVESADVQDGRRRADHGVDGVPDGR